MAFAIAAPCGIRAETTPGPFAPPDLPVKSFEAGSLHVDHYGSGPKSLILIPGLSCGPWVWSATIAKFAPNYSIYAITLPGFSGHPALAEGPLFPKVQKDFWALLESQKIDHPVLIGHSIGGTLSIVLAEEHSDRLSGVIAVDGLPIFPMLANAKAEQRKAAAAQMASSFTSLKHEELLAQNEQYMKGVGTIHSELIKPSAELESKSDPKAVAAWMKEDLENDWRPDLAKVTVPLVEIMPYNAPDAVPPRAFTLEQTQGFYQMLLTGAPKATVVPISPARHFAMLDQPDAFYKAVAAFLDSLK